MDIECVFSPSLQQVSSDQLILKSIQHRNMKHKQYTCVTYKITKKQNLKYYTSYKSAKILNNN